VLSLAQEEAQRFNDSCVSTEHLLLALVCVDDGVAIKVLSNLGVEPNAVRSAVESIHGRGLETAQGVIGLTPRAKKVVVELAVDEARRLNHHYIGTEHLLLGLVREGEGIAAGVLESLGVNLEKVRTQTIQVRSQTSQTPGGVASDVASDTIGAAPAMQGPTPPLAPPPLLRDLARVIPIGERQQHEGLTLTALALEVYADGCLLTVLLQRSLIDSTPPDQVPRFGIFGNVTVTMTDDRGGVYTGFLHGSSGSAVADFWEWRAQFACTPTLDPAARALRIEIPAVQWSYREHTEQGDLLRVMDEMMPGPWIFSVRLPAVET
jgi:hypothetical protein